MMFMKESTAITRKNSSLGSALFFILLLSCGCTKDPIITEIQGSTMGTTYSIKISHTEKLNSKNLKQEINKALIHVNDEMSTYQKNSTISLINNKYTKPVEVSSDFAKVFNFSINLSKKTNGAFDPTIGPLVNLWGFGPTGSRKKPTEAQINAAKKSVGISKVAIAQKNNKWFVSKSDPKAYLDFSSTAKGFGVDVVSKLLSSKKLTNHLVEIGGEMRASGNKNKDIPWHIAIEAPTPTKRSIQKILILKNMSIATSGNYRNFFKEGGKTFAHTINSKTGYPVEHRLASASVLSKTCLEADGLATALMAMGPEKAWNYVEKNNISAYLILINKAGEGFTVKPSDGFKRLIQK